MTFFFMWVFGCFGGTIISVFYERRLLRIHAVALPGTAHAKMLSEEDKNYIKAKVRVIGTGFLLATILVCKYMLHMNTRLMSS